MKSAKILTLAYLFSTLSLFALKAQETPNILFIIVDDLNDWVGYMGGHKYAKTPNIDKLAEKSFVFTNAHSTISWCNPSRISIMTGLHPLASGITHNQDYPLRNVLPDVFTIVEHLKLNDYYTAGFGKIYHLNDNYTEEWDYYDFGTGRPRPNNIPYHGMDTLIANDSFDWAPIDDNLENWGDHTISTNIINFINNGSNLNPPFFAALGYRLPHTPWYVPKEFWEETVTDSISVTEVISNDIDDLPNISSNMNGVWRHETIVENNKWIEATTGYLSAIRFIDFEVGRVLNALDNSELKNNTIIIFTSDHGFMLGEKQKWKKNLLWRDATHVPLLIYDPNLLSVDNKIINNPVSLLDIYPTIQNLAGLPNRKDLGGKDLYDLIINKDLNKSNRNLIALRYDGHFSLQDSNYHYLKYINGDYELYDYLKDPNEWYNLATDKSYQNIVSKFDSIYTSDFQSIELVSVAEKIEYLTYESSLPNTLTWKDNSYSVYTRFELKILKQDVTILDTLLFENFIALPFKVNENDNYDVLIRAKTHSSSADWEYFKLSNGIILSTKSENFNKTSFELEQNYPNPFNSSTIIKYKLEKRGIAKLNIFDSSGKLVYRVFNKHHEIGNYEFRIENLNISSGTYFYSLEFNGAKQFKAFSYIK